MNTAESDSVVRIELRAQPIRVLEWIMLVEMAGIVVFVAFILYRSAARGVAIGPHLWLMPLLTVAGAGPLIWRVLRRRRAEATIEIGPDGALLPSLFAPRNLRRVPLLEIRSIQRKTRGRGAFIAIGASTGTAIAIRDVEFRDPAGAHQLEAALRAAIAARPGGSTQLDAIERRGEILRLQMAGIPWVCVALAIAAGAVFALEAALGGWNPASSMSLMIRFGANAAALIHTGEWWRIVSANALHANVFHLGMNVLGFAVCGLVFERWIGWPCTLLVALAGGIGGTLASALITEPTISVGASTMVMGLYVGWIVAMVRHREALPHRAPIWTFVLIAVSLAIGEFAVPNIDHAGHVGGALAGGATVLLLTRDPDPLALRNPSRGLRIALAISCAVFAIGLGKAAHYAWTWSDERRLEMDRSLLASRLAPVVNDAAYDISKFAAASPELIAEADARMQVVAVPAGMEAAFTDTRATLAWRRGDLPRAIALGSESLRLAENGFQASQLARFEWAHARETGAPLRIGDGPEHVRFQLEAARSDEPGSVAILVEFGSRPALPAVIDAVAVRDDAPIAHLRLAVGPDVGTTMRLTTEDAEFESWESNVRLVTALIDGENAQTDGDKWRWRLWTMDPAVAAMP